MRAFHVPRAALHAQVMYNNTVRQGGGSASQRCTKSSSSLPPASASRNFVSDVGSPACAYCGVGIGGFAERLEQNGCAKAARFAIRRMVLA